jgi:hypothetical protein
MVMYCFSKVTRMSTQIVLIKNYEIITALEVMKSIETYLIQLDFVGKKTLL